MTWCNKNSRNWPRIVGRDKGFFFFFAPKHFGLAPTTKILDGLVAAIQREAARERAAAEERFVGLIDRVSQRTDAQFQQMQQGMMAMFGMITQLYTHTGLAPQQPGQPGLQRVGAPQLAVTPAPAPTAAPATSATPETTFSMSALLGSAGRPLFSPLPTTSLFQESPSAV